METTFVFLPDQFNFISCLLDIFAFNNNFESEILKTVPCLLTVYVRESMCWILGQAGPGENTSSSSHTEFPPLLEEV